MVKYNPHKNSTIVDLEESADVDNEPESKKIKLEEQRPTMEKLTLKDRIKKYLEENRQQKYLDIEKMTQSLHDNYPDYRRQKVKVLRSQVEIAFKELKEGLQKNAGKKKKNDYNNLSKNDKNATDTSQVEEVTVDESPIKKSMNNRLSTLYDSNKKNNNDDDECEIIDVDDDTSNKTDKRPEENGDIAEVIEDVEKKSDNCLTDFEKIQAKAKNINRKLESPSEKPIAKKSTPSKNLSSFMSPNTSVAPVSVPQNKAEERISNLSVTTPSAAPSVPVRPPLVSSPPPADTTVVPLLPDPVQTFTTSAKKRDVQVDVNSSKKRDIEADISNSSVKKKARKVISVSPTTSSKTFKDFGGNSGVLVSACRLLLHLRQPELYSVLGCTPPTGFLLHGPPGTGKTLLANCIAGELGLPFLSVAGPELVSGVSGDSESKVRQLFEEAEAIKPCILFIDEIDCVSGRREQAGREMERRLVSQLGASMDSCGEGVIVMGATSRPEAMEPALRRAGRFDRELGLGIPSRGDRQSILEVITRGLALHQGEGGEGLVAWLAQLTPGYVGADLVSLAREAASSAAQRILTGQQGQEGELQSLMSCLRSPVSSLSLSGATILRSDWVSALKNVQPSAKREGFATVPDVSWSDVGALQEVREELQLHVLAPTQHQVQFQSLGLRNSSGILLVGPPGCGKTLVAKAVANEAGINFISVKGPELMNMYVGESERAVRTVFQRAKNSKPCVIFFDEIDSLCPKRSAGSSDGGSRVVNQLLTEMDGVEGREGVWVMAASNRPDILDPAVLRPGRLDKTLYVGFPSPSERVEILGALTRGGTKPRVDEGVTLEEVGSDARCQGFSGADVGNLVREAAMAAFRESISGGEAGEPRVGRRHWERAFQVVRPSVGDRERQRYEEMRVKYAGRARETEMQRITVESSRPPVISPAREVNLSGDLSSDTAPLPPVSSRASMVTELDISSSSGGDEELSMEVNGIEEGSSNFVNDCPENPWVPLNSLVVVGLRNEQEPTSPNTSTEMETEKESSPATAEYVTAKESSPTTSEYITADDGGKPSSDGESVKSPSIENASVTLTEENTLPLSEGVTSLKKKEELPKTTLPQIKAVQMENSKEVSTDEESGCKNDGQIADFYTSLNVSSDSGECVPCMRFLPDMLIRVIDSCTVKDAAGKTGKILSSRQGKGAGGSLNVKLDGLIAARIVKPTDLEPMIPEEGDKVKSLVVTVGALEEIGELLTLDDEDQAHVKYPSQECPVKVHLETLCKVLS